MELTDAERILAKLRIYPVLKELLACLCAGIEEDTCYCGIVVGDIPLDTAPVGGGDCGGVVAYVRVVNSFSSTSFPNVDALGMGRLAYSVAVGVIRPAPLYSDRQVATDEDETLFAMQQLADHQVMSAAIRCCLNEEKFDTLQTSALTYTPLERSDVGGGEWTLLIQV